ncbi:MAG: type I secretion system permease/ATPase [Campylobacterota bacterium]|nr:type I secretion system permease/ATPase [Campylobacterota bacterium]
MKKEYHLDPLLACLVVFTKLHHRPFSAESLTAGLPLKDTQSMPKLFSMDDSKSNFSRAAARAGFTSKLIKRDINDISEMVLPVILLLHDQDACILEAIDKQNNRAKIIIPEMPEGEEWIDLDILNQKYIGFTFFIKKEYTKESRIKTIDNSKKQHWFWGTIKRSSDIYRDVLVASIMINLFVLAAPLFTMNVYDRVVPNGAVETMWVLAIGVMVVYFLDMILKFMRTYFLEVAGKKSDVIMSSIIFEKVMNLKMDSRPKSVGSFASNLKDFESIRSFFTSSTVSTLIDLPFTIIFLTVTYYIAGLIVLVPIVMMILILGYSLSVRKPLQHSIESTYAASAQKNSVLIESLVNLETIKILGAGGHAQYHWEEATGEIADKSLKSRILSSSITTLTSFFIQLNTVFVLIVGVYMIDEMILTMGGLIASVILTSRAISPMGQVAGLLANYEQTKTAYTQLNSIMEMPVERPEEKRFIYRDTFDGKIVFDDVTFTYPEEDKESLKNVSFTINPGERVGIIGKIGSGKSTIQKLIMNLYQPQSGSVLIDDIDINQLDPADLRKQISYVPQDVALFNGTLRDNIVYKVPDAHDEAIIRASYIGLVDQFVNQHPKGYDMTIGEQGYGISGGQRQSVTIARAFVNDSSIIMLDEPSNSMDSSTEQILLSRLKEATQDKTTILVTHKTSLMGLVDRLIIIDNGKVAMDGPKQQVLKALKGGGNG